MNSQIRADLKMDLTIIGFDAGISGEAGYARPLIRDPLHQELFALTIGRKDGYDVRNLRSLEALAAKGEITLLPKEYKMVINVEKSTAQPPIDGVVMAHLGRSDLRIGYAAQPLIDDLAFESLRVPPAAPPPYLGDAMGGQVAYVAEPGQDPIIARLGLSPDTISKGGVEFRYWADTRERLHLILGYWSGVFVRRFDADWEMNRYRLPGLLSGHEIPGANLDDTLHALETSLMRAASCARDKSQILDSVNRTVQYYTYTEEAARKAGNDNVGVRLNERKERFQSHVSARMGMINNSGG